MSGFYPQTRESFELEAEKSHRRDESERTWLDSFMKEAKEIDDKLKQIKEELK